MTFFPLPVGFGRMRWRNPPSYLPPRHDCCLCPAQFPWPEGAEGLTDWKGPPSLGLPEPLPHLPQAWEPPTPLYIYNSFTQIVIHSPLSPTCPLPTADRHAQQHTAPSHISPTPNEWTDASSSSCPLPNCAPSPPLPHTRTFPSSGMDRMSLPPSPTHAAWAGFPGDRVGR